MTAGASRAGAGQALRILTVRGERRRLAVSGRGPALLLLHGFTGTADSFARVAGRLGASRTLIAPEALGHAGSGVPERPERLSLAEQAEDLARILAELCITRADVLGYSMGGRLALSLAVAHPERVARLVLESAGPGIPDAAARRARRQADDRLADLLDRDGLDAFLAHWESLARLRPGRPVPRPWLARQAAERRRHLAHGLAQSLRGAGAGGQPPLGDALSRMAMPVLCLAGAADEKYVAEAAAMATRLPFGEAAIVERAGHTVHLDAPRAFLGRVTAFLERDGPRAGVPHGVHDPVPGP